MTSQYGVHSKIDRQKDKEHQRVDELAARIHRNIDEQALVDHKHFNKELLHNEKQRMHDIQRQHEKEVSAKRHSDNRDANNLTYKQLAEIKWQEFESDLNKKRILHQKQKEQEERLTAIRHKNFAASSGDDSEQSINDISRSEHRHYSTRSKPDTHEFHLKNSERHKTTRENRSHRKRSEKEIKVVDIHSRLTLDEVQGRDRRQVAVNLVYLNPHPPLPTNFKPLE